MAEKLQLDDVVALLRSDVETILGMYETGRLHGVRQGESWTTTKELLESDLELLTEALRIDRLRSGIVPAPAGADGEYAWMTSEWVDDTLCQIRG